MKSFTLAAFSFFLIVFFNSCAKNGTDSTTGTTDLAVSQAGSLQIGQPVTFTLSSVATTANVTWTVNPSQATVSSSGNTASVMFQSSGKYVVTGVSGSTNGSSTVTVDSTRYTPPGGGGTSTTAAFSAGEQLNITAKRIDSSTNSGLLFSVLTTNSYNCQNNFLLSSSTKGANSLSMDFTGVYVPASCTAGSAKAAATILSQFPFPTGTSQLTINFNGTKYTGTIVKTGNSYAINWSYTSGVVISPATL